MTQQEKDNIDNDFQFTLKEAAHWYGGWDKLREIMKTLEDNENEAHWERSQNEPGAWEGGFADNH